ncbi:peroxisomal biogenesis factor 19-like [Clavelina lepadiformis]|uniref:peroxisomal biogenesis factor 19-like n=1 Tax=Clavelina lepadiformis TaxID=159417 RepID=UPI004042976D
MDPDLDNLLEDALADFDKPAAKPKTTPDAGPSSSSKVTSSASKLSTCPGNPNQHNLNPPTEIFKEFFDDDLTEKLQEEWATAMKELVDDSPELASQLQFMSKATESMGGCDLNKDPKKGNFDQKIKATLESMSQALDDEDISEDEIMKKMLNMGMGDSLPGDGIPGDGIPGDELGGLGMMEELMKSMLSKEMLYPPMKELCKNYPQWLENNKKTISSRDMENYQKQLSCLQKICVEFENETDSNTEDEKKTRLTRIMDNVNEMQKYGQPPEALVPNGNSSVPESCIVS